MRWTIVWASLLAIGAALGVGGHVGLQAQNAQNQSSSVAIKQEQRNLRNANLRNKAALERSNILRNQADETTQESRRFAFQKQAINEDINAARANLDAARARIAIISQRQSLQQRELAQQTSPILRLMGALENMTRRPATLMVMQPQSLDDYVHLRAVMASVQPKIAQQTAGLRGQIDLQKNLRDQQKIALLSLDQAQAELARQQTSLGQLNGGDVNQSGALDAGVALEFERAIVAGERARDIVENIDNIQNNDEVLAALAVLDGPTIRDGSDDRDAAANDSSGDVSYILPASAQIISGFGELSENGYRERGVLMSLAPAATIQAPASGIVNYAGDYRNFGRIVIIEHGGGWATLITNMASLSVSKGDKIEQNGEVGTAKSRDNEILIELRRNNRPMDILALVSG